MFEIKKSSKINFYYIILPLNSAIYFQVKSGKKFLFNAKKIL